MVSGVPLDSGYLTSDVPQLLIPKMRQEVEVDFKDRYLL